MLITSTTLATLPRAAGDTAKHTKAANVCTLSTLPAVRNDPARSFLRRKQRSEVVLDVPGEGVQIYNVRTAKIVASYVPPSAGSLLCAPASVFVKPTSAGGGDGYRRVTVATIQPFEARSSCKIVTWTEHIGTNVPLKDRVVVREREVQAEKLVSINITIVTREDTNVQEVCVVGIQQDGRLQCWNEALESIANVAPDGPAVSCDALFLCDLQRASQQLLKGRDDITLTAASGGMHELIISIQTAAGTKKSTDKSKTAVKIYGVRSLVSPKDRFTPIVQELATLSLPTTTISSGKTPSFWLHLASGRLFQHSEDGLCIYRLTGASPKLEQELHLGKQVSRMYPIAYDMVAISSGSTVDVIDTKHKAALASFAFSERAPKDSKPTINGTASGHAGGADVEFLFFDPSAACLVVLRDRQELVALDIGHGEPGQPTKKAKRTTLADAVGRGMQLNSENPYAEMSISIPRKVGKAELQHDSERDWTQIAKNLGKAATKGDAEAFDEIVNKESGALVSGFGKPNQKLLDIVLTNIFELKAEREERQPYRQVAARLCPMETMAKLASWGLFTDLQLELSLKRQKHLAPNSSLEPQAIVKSLGIRDPSLSTLQRLLQLQVKFSAADLAHMTRFGLRRLMQVQKLDGRLLLTGAAPAMPNGDSAALPNGIHNAQANGVDDMEVDSGAVAILPEGSEGDRDALLFTESFIEETLQSLYRLPRQQLAAAISSELDHSDLLALFYLLRNSIARSGWGLTLDDPAPESSSLFEGEFESVPFVVLDAMLDAFGLNGWVNVASASGSNVQDDDEDSEDDYATNLLSEMRGEVQIALSSARESALLSGLLEQALLYSRRVAKGRNLDALIGDGQKSEQDGGGAGVEDGRHRAVVKPTLVAEQDGGAQNNKNALPLGSRFQVSGLVDPAAVRRFTRAKKTDKISVRELGHMKSMNVGEHTLEQIRF